MFMKQKIKKKILYIGAFLFLLYNHVDKVYYPKYEILQNNLVFARYSGGKIYIGKYSYLKECYTYYEEGDIFILDSRYSINNPSMKTFSSYEIHDKDIRNEILDVLCRYEECFPSNWDRSIESMRLEWFMHNVSYLFHNRRDRTTDVDLDNNDEEKNDDQFFMKILKL